MLQTSANSTRRINASSGFYYAVLPSFAGCPFILVRCPCLLSVRVHTCAPALVCPSALLHVLCIYESAYQLPVRDLKSLSQRGLNHLSSGGLSRATSGLSYQSIDVAAALPVALRSRFSSRPMPHHGGILIGMQVAFRLPTSADIDPPADAEGGDRWTVTSEWEEIGTCPLTSPSVEFRHLFCSVWLCMCLLICPSLLSLCPCLVSYSFLLFLSLLQTYHWSLCPIKVSGLVSAAANCRLQTTNLQACLKCSWRSNTRSHRGNIFN